MTGNTKWSVVHKSTKSNSEKIISWVYRPNNSRSSLFLFCFLSFASARKGCSVLIYCSFSYSFFSSFHETIQSPEAPRWPAKNKYPCKIVNPHHFMWWNVICQWTRTMEGIMYKLFAFPLHSFHVTSFLSSCYSLVGFLSLGELWDGFLWVYFYIAALDNIACAF